jgi:energy-coupling factor transport system permease protein
VAATVTAVNATLLGGVVGPVALTVLAVLLPGALAGILPRLLRVGLVVALPLAVSVLIVNLFFFPTGATVLFRVGPITATAEGLAFAVETLARLMAITGALVLFYLTTPIGSLVVDLERRGVSARVAFVVSASVRTVPAIVERAGQIADAQRARGLDTEGSLWRRIRGLIPLVGPVLLGSIGDVEARAMALEARGFSRSGPRSLLWAPADRDAERVARWLMVLSVPALVVAGLAGWLPGWLR